MQRFSIAACALLLLGASHNLLAQPAPAAVAAFQAYAGKIESRLAQQHRAAGTFLAPAASDATAAIARLRQGERIVEKLTPATGAEVSGSLLHHWRGTAFVPGAHAADFVRIMQDYSSYPRTFAPEIVRASLTAHHGDRFAASMRVRQKHVITVVMDTAYDITYGRLDPQHGYSISHSTRISEIDHPGTPAERALTPSQEHGFLWRLNTYWSYAEQDGGLYLQVEAVSLTRSIPHGLGWVIGPYVESVPRESLEFTLRSACNALRK